MMEIVGFLWGDNLEDRQEGGTTMPRMATVVRLGDVREISALALIGHR